MAKAARAKLEARIPPELKARLENEADRRDMSVSKLLEITLLRQLPFWEADPRMEGR